MKKKEPLIKNPSFQAILTSLGRRKRNEKERTAY